jgi:hypothetical protein
MVCALSYYFLLPKSLCAKAQFPSCAFGRSSSLSGHKGRLPLTRGIVLIAPAESAISVLRFANYVQQAIRKVAFKAAASGFAMCHYKSLLNCRHSLNKFRNTTHTHTQNSKFKPLVKLKPDQNTYGLMAEDEKGSWK